jgi:catechol 2,3-dioxygenase
MITPLVLGVRDIAIGVTDLDAAARFYTDTWHLDIVARSDDAVYLRGTGASHHLLALHRAERAEVRMLSFHAASADALDIIAANAAAHGGAILALRHPVAEPGGGEAVVIEDPQGRVLRFVHGDTRHADPKTRPDRPVKITHVVFNSADVAAGQRFFEQALGFRLSDRTRIMAFLRCASDHHTIALADADDNTLNHIAFLMPDLDSVMRGAGRMRDDGYAIEWGVGRHGPGDNVFSYFIGPSGFVIEYTAEVEQVDDTYVAGGPDDWKWPPGRVDQWGVSAPPSPRIKEAQRAIRFAQHAHCGATGGRNAV